MSSDFALQKANKIDAAKSQGQMEEFFRSKATLWLAQIHYHLGDWNSLVQMLDESLKDKELFPAQYLDSLLLMGIHAAIELEQFNLADNWVRLFKELSQDRNDLLFSPGPTEASGLCGDQDIMRTDER